MGYVSTFNFTTFSAAYPYWPGVTQPQAQAQFDFAALYWRNDSSSPAPTQAIQDSLMNLLTAHLLALNFNADGTTRSPTDPAGRIASASEGSVSVSFDVGAGGSPSEAWFTQTRFGFAYWQATAGFRMGQYRVAGLGRYGGAGRVPPYGRW